MTARGPARRCGALWALLAVALAAPPVGAWEPPAQAERDRDDAVFGGDDEPAAAGRDDAIFGGEEPGGDAGDGGDGGGGLLRSTLELMTRLDEVDDLLQIGGQLWLRLDWYTREEGKASSFPLVSPNLLDLYLDVRPNDRIRGYVQGRLSHDLTAGPQSQDPYTGQPREPTRVALDQLWVKLDIERWVFVTAGRQPLRWGTGRLWNPTDFLNRSFKDPLAVFDERLGLSLVKVHVPIESLGWNLYAIADLEGADAVDKVGVALRAEMLFDTTELALAFAYRKDEPWRVGASISTSVSLLDLRAEVALLNDVRTLRWFGDFDLETFAFPEGRDQSDKWHVRAMGGAEIGLHYGDDDALYLGAEYAYNSLGYDDGDLNLWLLFQGDFVPFYTGRHYAAAYLYLPSPGRWDEASFNLTGIGNLSDLSFTARLDFRVRTLTFLDFNAYAALHFGKAGGEFRLAADLPAVPGVEGLESGLSIAPPLLDLGVGLRVRL